MRELALAVLQTGTASFIAVAAAVAATKIFAVIVGPAGIGLISLVRQTYQSALMLGTLNGQGAIAQGIASREGEAQAEYSSTVLWVLLMAGGATALALLCVPAGISRLVLGRVDGVSVQFIRWLSPAVLAGTGTAYLTGVLNGHRAVARSAVVQVAGAVVAGAVAYPVALLLRAGHALALSVQIVLPAITTIALGLACVMRGGWMPKPLRSARPVFDPGAAKEFAGLATAMLFSGVVATSVPLVVRAVAARRFGLAGVGIFDVGWNISMNYVLLALASFSTYYVPSLSRLKHPHDQHELIHRVLRLTLVLMVPMVVAVIVLKPVVVRALYSAAFLPALEIMRWMLVGDYFRVTSWVFSFTMVAFADVRTVVWTEIVWGGLSIGGSVLGMVHFGTLQAVGVNVLLVYGTYLAFTLFYVGSRRHFAPDAPVACMWLAGLALIIAASAHTWRDLDVHPTLAVAYIAAAIGFACIILTPGERREIWKGLCRTFHRRHLASPEHSAPV